MLVFALGSLALTPYLLRIGLKWADSDIADADVTTRKSSGERTAADALVIGIGPIGRRVVELLDRRGQNVCAIDLSPANLHSIAVGAVRTVAGDAADLTTLARAGANDADLAIVCVPDDDVAVRVVAALRRLNRRSAIIVRCRYLARREDAHRAGATAVVSEEEQIAEALLNILERPSSTSRPVR